jgi:hypothetical protein
MVFENCLLKDYHLKSGMMIWLFALKTLGRTALTSISKKISVHNTDYCSVVGSCQNRG